MGETSDEVRKIREQQALQNYCCVQDQGVVTRTTIEKGKDVSDLLSFLWPDLKGNVLFLKFVLGRLMHLLIRVYENACSLQFHR